MIDAYPLQWPFGWKRTERYARQSATFGSKSLSNYRARLSISEGTQRVIQSLRKMGFTETVVVSTNLLLRNDGLPRSGQAEPSDPGAAVYWGRLTPRCMAIDRYDRVADNLGAIAATLEAMRAIERHGGAAILDRAFTGFAALPNPNAASTPWEVLGVPPNSSPQTIDEAYRRLASLHHPDRGGDAAHMALINSARDALRGPFSFAG